MLPHHHCTQRHNTRNAFYNAYSLTNHTQSPTTTPAEIIEANNKIKASNQRPVYVMTKEKKKRSNIRSQPREEIPTTHHLRSLALFLLLRSINIHKAEINRFLNLIR